MKNNYNERSWAIDVITEINLIVSGRRRTIRRAGGERTLKASTKSSSLFPDVLLLQDETGLRILQGWELKMPDTALTNAEFISNATKKANILGLNSFLLWNVTEAALYVSENGFFNVRKQWSDLADITRRDEVEANKDRWVTLLAQIIDELEDYFTNGVIRSQNIAETLSEDKVIDVIIGNIGLVKQNLQEAARRNSILSATIQEWWETIRIEYSSEREAFAAISKLVLVTWVNRFLFTHYLKIFTNKAREIDSFNETTSLEQAKRFFNELTAENDFLNVFAPIIGEDYIDSASWAQIIQLNLFLSELQLQDIDQGLLQLFFERLLLVSKRKTAGQYATPYPLANYLARLVMIDKTLPVSDPFCGTGTILRACFDVKVSAGESFPNAIGSIWGSDKFSFPLQITTLSLARPEIMGYVINVFKSDVKDLEIGTQYNFTDPNTGQIVPKLLPRFEYIISNLPFVEAAKIKISNPDIFNILPRLAEILNDPDFTIPSKSDLIAYLPYYLWQLLTDTGRIGLIVSNSWLGTEWGEHFRTTLNRFFKISKVITSGDGIWFENADVVTNIIVLDKRITPVEAPPSNEETAFITMNIPIQQLSDNTIVERVANQTLLGRNGLVNVRTITKRNIDELYLSGLGWTACFANLSWFNRVQDKLVKGSSLFDINRGERRGWDKMFYPPASNGIEDEFLKPVLKNLRSVPGLIANADGIAFCCSKSIEELEEDGSTGALGWIRRFENGVNNTGEPLIQSLDRANHYWYEMKATTVADLIATINYGQTIVIGKMRERSFVNQRLIRFTAKDGSIDIDLCHALMNSYLGIFYIEALGFGRGLGALDLSSTKMKYNYHLLNPDLIGDDEKEKIKNSFLPLKQRDIEFLPAEVELRDRKVFENVVANAYGLSDEWDEIKQSLIELHKIRMSVKR